MAKRLGRSGVVLAALLAAAPASAEDVVVHVENIRNDQGSVLVAVCTPDDFLSAHCRHNARVKAHAGAADILVGGVPPGQYAVQAFHDENDNSELDRNLIGMPREGIAFSRDAPMRMGPPRFSDAAVEIGQNGASLTLSMRYF